MKPPPESQRRILVVSGLLGLLSYGGLYVLGGLLRIPSNPFSLHDGWQPFVGWLVLFALLSGFLRWSLGPLWRSVKPPRNPDLYTAVEAELAAERTVSEA